MNLNMRILRMLEDTFSLGAAHVIYARMSPTPIIYRSNGKKEKKKNNKKNNKKKKKKTFFFFFFFTVFGSNVYNTWNPGNYYL